MELFNEIRQRASSAFQVVRNVLFGQKEVVSSIKINGNRYFCEVVREALLLLQTKDLSSFNLINRHLDLIIQSGRTSLSPFLQNEEIGATLALDGEQVKNASKTWLACLLAYYGYCGKYYYDYKREHKGSFRMSWTGDFENRARDFMYDCLKNIGGSYEELQHLANFIKEEQGKTGKQGR